MQLRDGKKPHSLSLPVRASETITGYIQQKESSNSFVYFADGHPISDSTSRMNSRVEKAKLDVVCPHCSKRIKWAWLIQYHSYQYTQLVYVCSECEQVMRIQNAPKAPKDSPVLLNPRLQRKK